MDLTALLCPQQEILSGIQAEREGLGAELYGVQQQLVWQHAQMLVERELDSTLW